MVIVVPVEDVVEVVVGIVVAAIVVVSEVDYFNKERGTDSILTALHSLTPHSLHTHSSLTPHSTTHVLTSSPFSFPLYTNHLLTL